MAGRVLVDASSLIALTNIGALDLLKRLFGTIHTTPVVQEEVVVGDQPGHTALAATFDDSIITHDAPKVPDDPLPRLGLGPGETSLLHLARDADLLLIDDRNARRYADVHGLRRKGLLGLLVTAVTRGRLDPDEGLQLLRRLAESDFRMTIELYQWAIGRIEDARESA